MPAGWVERMWCKTWLRLNQNQNLEPHTPHTYEPNNTISVWNAVRWTFRTIQLTPIQAYRLSSTHYLCTYSYGQDTEKFCTSTRTTYFQSYIPPLSLLNLG